MQQKREPCVSFEKMHSMAWIKSKAIEVDVTDESSSKMNKDRVKNLLAPVEELIGRVREQKQRISQAIRTRHDKEVREAKKKAEAEQHAAVAAVASEKLKIQQNEQKPIAPVRSYALLNHMVRYADIPSYRAAEFEPSSDTWTKPFIITDFAELEHAMENTDNFKKDAEEFEKAWLASPQRKPTGSGRAARLVSSRLDVALLDKATAGYRPAPVALKAKLGDAISSFQQPWHFAYSGTLKSVGFEYQFMSTFKYIFKGGKPRIVLVSLTRLEEHFNAAAAPGTVVTLPKLNNFFTEMGEEHVKKLADSGALYHAVLEPLTWLFIPPGFLSMEAVADETDVVGIRWLCLPSTESAESASADDESYKSFKRLANFLQPTNGSGAEPAAAHKLALSVASFIE